MTDLTGTVGLMQSADYIDRFKAEYYQLYLRLERLSAMIKEYEKGTLGYTPDCPIENLIKQKVHMTDYLNDLKVRAVIEGISL